MKLEDLMTKVDEALKAYVKTIQLNPGELRQVATYLKDFMEAPEPPKPAPAPPAPVVPPVVPPK